MPDKLTDAEELRRQAFVIVRERLGTQEDVARMLGVSAGTISRKERGETPVKPRDMAALERLLAERDPEGDPSERLAEMVPRGTYPERRGLPKVSSVREPTPVYPLPRKLEIMALDFEREALAADADEHFMRYARARLRDPALFEMYAGGHDTRPLTAVEQLDDYTEVIEDLRRILKKRQKRLDSQSGKLAP